jgi:hypothetical protein
MRTSRGWRTWVRRTLKTMLVFVLAVVVVIGGYVGLVAVRHVQPVTLPAPAGPYRVGRVAFDWTDHARTDPLAPRPSTPRELSVWLWYPAAPHASGRRAPYAPGAWGRLHLKSLQGLGESSFDAIRNHALDGVPVAAGRFPIVVLEPGLGFAAPQYTTLAENLAGHGYLVAGVTPTYSANLTVLHGHAVPKTTAGDPPAFDAANLHTGSAAQKATSWSTYGPPTPGSPPRRWPGSTGPAGSPGTSTWRAPPTSATRSAARHRLRPAVPTRTARAPSTSTAPSTARSCTPA